MTSSHLWRSACLPILIALAACAAQEASPPAEVRTIFTALGADVGLDFIHDSGSKGDYHMAEITGAGGGFIDFDNDGDLDVFLVQSGAFDGSLASAAGGSRLYRNELNAGDGGNADLRLVDVTAASGIGAPGYGIGVTSADYDNDGWVDLYVTKLGANVLWRNNGNGTFTDVTAAAGVEETRWSVPAVFFDFDRDGWLDLFLGNYLEVDPEVAPVCRDFVGQRDYCAPSSFEALQDRLLRNRGDGTFEDVTAAAGIDTAYGPALGAVAADFDGDGWLDLYVANDGQPNQLWINGGDGHFTDEALFAGCAVNGTGNPEASMGVDAADFDSDGDIDLFVAHLRDETSTLYLNDGSGIFDDGTTGSRLGFPSRASTTFGAAALDYDNDGALDLVVANGAVRRLLTLAEAGDPFPFHQPDQIFRNLGAGRFEEVEAAGEGLAVPRVSRGIALGDVDNDGDTDTLIASNRAAPRLLRNQVGTDHHWLGLRLLDVSGKRDALGALVALERSGQPPLLRRVRTDGSYASTHDPRVRFGLGTEPAFTAVRVTWPDGSAETWHELEVDRYHTLRQGNGAPTAAVSTAAGAE